MKFFVFTFNLDENFGWYNNHENGAAGYVQSGYGNSGNPTFRPRDYVVDELGNHTDHIGEVGNAIPQGSANNSRHILRYFLMILKNGHRGRGDHPSVRSSAEGAFPIFAEN